MAVAFAVPAAPRAWRSRRRRLGPRSWSLSFALGLTYPWRKVPIDTLVQESIPDRFRGRVFSLYDLAFSTARVLAALLAVVLVPQLSTGGMLALIGPGYLVWTPVLPPGRDGPAGRRSASTPAAGPTRRRGRW